MEQKSIMVVASKYELKVRDTKKGKGAYDVDGQKEKKHGDKIVPRAWVEARNEQLNNEHYIINEEATAEMVEERAKNVVKNAQKAKREQATTADLIDAIANGRGGNVQAQELKSEPDVSKEELAAKDKENEALKQRIAEMEAKEKAEKAEESDKPNEETTQGNTGEVLLPEGEPNESWTINQLKKYLDDKGLKYHAASKEVKLLEIINENK